jgi:hypothetical protein
VGGLILVGIIVYTVFGGKLEEAWGPFWSNLSVEQKKELIRPVLTTAQKIALNEKL